MFAAILAIVASLVVIAGIAYFFISGTASITEVLDFCRGVYDLITSLVPTWLLPFAAIALGLAIVGIVIKVI